VWCSIVLAIVLFGLGHFPGTAAITAITPVIVVWVVLLNGVLGIPFDFCTGKRAWNPRWRRTSRLILCCI